MAGMPYPPTDTPSSVLKKPVLLFFCLFKQQHVLMFSCLIKQQHVLMFSCLFKQQHVLMSSKQQHVLMFFCLFNNNMFSCSSVFSNNNMFSCSLVFQKQHVLLSFPKKNHVLPSNYVFMSPKKTAESNAPSR